MGCIDLFCGDLEWEDLGKTVQGRQVQEIIQNNPNLKYANFSEPSFGPERLAEYLAVGLAWNTHLQSLTLRNTSLDSIDAADLAAGLSHNKKLRHLNILDGNYIDDLGTQALAYSLKFNKTLTHLCIRDSGIANDGAKYLAAILTINSRLTALSLRDNSIKQRGAEYLIEALQTNYTLRSLDLQGNRIEEKYLNKIDNLLYRNETLHTLNKYFRRAQRYANKTVNDPEIFNKNLHRVFAALDKLEAYPEVYSAQKERVDGRFGDLYISSGLELAFFSKAPSAKKQRSSTRSSHAHHPVASSKDLSHKSVPREHQAKKDTTSSPANAGFFETPKKTKLSPADQSKAGPRLGS